MLILSAIQDKCSSSKPLPSTKSTLCDHRRFALPPFRFGKHYSLVNLDWTENIMILMKIIDDDACIIINDFEFIFGMRDSRVSLRLSCFTSFSILKQRDAYNTSSIVQYLDDRTS